MSSSMIQFDNSSGDMAYCCISCNGFVYTAQRLFSDCCRQVCDPELQWAEDHAHMPA